MPSLYFPPFLLNSAEKFAYLDFFRTFARLYGVETKRLNEQVRRNIERFPEDFMFQLSKEEFENWKSQFATSSAEENMSSQFVTTYTQNMSS